MGSYFTRTPLCLQHTAGTALLDIPPMCVSVRVLRPSFAQIPTLPQNCQSRVVLTCILYNPAPDIDPVSESCQTAIQFVTLAIRSRHGARTLAHHS